MTGRLRGKGLPGMCCLCAKLGFYLEQGSIVEYGSVSAELGLTLHPCLLSQHCATVAYASLTSLRALSLAIFFHSRAATSVTPANKQDKHFLTCVCILREGKSFGSCTQAQVLDNNVDTI